MTEQLLLQERDLESRQEFKYPKGYMRFNKMVKNKSGLPIVTEGLLESFLHDAESGSFDAETVFREMTGDEKTPGENHLIALYIKGTLAQLSPEEGLRAAGYMIGIYELLRRQGESDLLEQTS
jgi:hypothetical protein